MKGVAPDSILSLLFFPSVFLTILLIIENKHSTLIIENLILFDLLSLVYGGVRGV